MKFLCVFLLLSGWLSAYAQKQPNIVVFIADDMGWEESTPYGNNYIHTPNLQRLAKEGMRFDNFFLTASSCSPSRASIMTSKYPHNTGAMNLHEDLKADTELFPFKLSEAGYHTMLVGKSHGTNKKEMQAKFGYLQLVDWSKPWEMAKLWITALEQRPKDKPFFLWAASIDPHRPFRQGEYPYKHNPDSVFVPPYYPDIPEIRRDLADYYDEIGRFDQHIGVVLKYLEDNHELDNTIILVLSDNGKAFPQCKTRVNLQGLKSPFIVRYPKLIRPGSTTKSLVSSVDIAPTLLRLANAKPMAQTAGVPFDALFSKPTATVREYAFGEHNWHNYMAYERVAISKDFVYIRNWLPGLPQASAGEIVPTPFYQAMQALYWQGKLDTKYADSFLSPRPAEELFGYGTDIHCMKNLAGDKKQAKALTNMRGVLDDWLKTTSDNFPGIDKLKKDGLDRLSGNPLQKEK